MRVPLWIGGPAVIALSALDATLELQGRAVRALTRTVVHSMREESHIGPGESMWAEPDDRPVSLTAVRK